MSIAQTLSSTPSLNTLSLNTPSFQEGKSFWNIVTIFIVVS